MAVGGLFYEADALPQAWRGRYIAADLLDHSVHAHEVTPLGSTFQARQAATCCGPTTPGSPRPT